MKDVKDICAQAIAEGMVMLENDGMLPLRRSDKIAVFGRAQFEYIKSGSGSGGLVVCPYVTNIGDELKKRVNYDIRAERFYRDWIKSHPYDNGDNWEIPQSQKEAEPTDTFIKELSRDNEKAIIVISRICGECFELKTEKGGYYLTDEEEQTIKKVSRFFKHTCVLLNVGNIIDMQWVKKYNVGTVVYVWQGGQEGGEGVAKALMGETPISGRLTDTIATELGDYPAAQNFGDSVKNIHTEDIYVGYRYFETFAKDKVLYPFGYGLSYTTFEYLNISAHKADNILTVEVTVKNTGDFVGKEVVQCYLQKPNGKLGNPARELAAFKKTKLLQPNESQRISLEINLTEFAAYDDSGVTGVAYSYVLEAGEYNIYLGNNVRDAQKIFSHTSPNTVCVRKCVQACAPVEKYKRLATNDGVTPVYQVVPVAQYGMNERISNDLPIELEMIGDKSITLQNVAGGKNTLDEFIAQFDITELCGLVRGEGMSSPKAPIEGTAGSFGGLSQKMHDRGVPVITTVDGPCGVRLTKKDGYATCIPTGTLLACTWSLDTVYEQFEIFANELKEYALDVALAPGMNIHRHVLGGRNFEYFSEDPYITGQIAATIAKCFNDNGVRCTLKHFAVNSQEYKRDCENEVLSERALREIYLKGFEIAIKSGYVQYVMSSYNRINGISASSNYDLLTVILRKEWGYKGVVMTDWWTKIDDTLKGTYGEHNLAAMVRAQNDLYMVTSDASSNPDDLETAIENGQLTVAQLQRCAKNIFSVITQSLSFKTFDSARQFLGTVGETPIAVYKGAECRVDIEREGIYLIKLTYSCLENDLVQTEEKVLFNGNERQIVLLKGTGGEIQTQTFTLYLHNNALIQFEGSANISVIEIYEIKH